MYENARVGVVVPCYNEELLIGQVIETMPDFVDRIFVIDDFSADATSERVKVYVDANPERITLITHEVNQGVGGAIATGYKAALAEQHRRPFGEATQSSCSSPFATMRTKL